MEEVAAKDDMGEGGSMKVDLSWKMHFAGHCWC